MQNSKNRFFSTANVNTKTMMGLIYRSKQTILESVWDNMNKKEVDELLEISAMACGYNKTYIGNNFSVHIASSRTPSKIQNSLRNIRKEVSEYPISLKKMHHYFMFNPYCEKKYNKFVLNGIINKFKEKAIEDAGFFNNNNSIDGNIKNLQKKASIERLEKAVKQISDDYMIIDEIIKSVLFYASSIKSKIKFRDSYPVLHNKKRKDIEYFRIHIRSITKLDKVISKASDTEVGKLLVVMGYISSLQTKNVERGLYISFMSMNRGKEITEKYNDLQNRIYDRRRMRKAQRELFLSLLFKGWQELKIRKATKELFTSRLREKKRDESFSRRINIDRYISKIVGSIDIPKPRETNQLARDEIEKMLEMLDKDIFFSVDYYRRIRDGKSRRNKLTTNKHLGSVQNFVSDG